MEGETNILQEGHTAEETMDCRLSQIQNKYWNLFPHREYYGQSINWIPQTGLKLVFSYGTGAAEPAVTYLRGPLEGSKQASTPEVHLVQVIFTDSSD